MELQYLKVGKGSFIMQINQKWLPNLGREIKSGTLDENAIVSGANLFLEASRVILNNLSRFFSSENSHWES
jgi:hypothetical protein